MTLEIHLQIDPRSGIPAYRQVMDQVRYYVAAGTLSAGDQLPSIRELARTLGVNPTTVIRAYTELEQAEVLERHQGKGVFVRRTATSSDNEQAQSDVRRAARQLVVVARQTGLSLERTVQMVRDEHQRMEET